jgi:hypothetical protein
MRRTERIHAIEACRLLNEHIGDLVIGSRASGLLDTPAIRPKINQEFKITMNRMCLWHTIATLSKWQELYDCYNEIFPVDVRKAARDLRKELEKRGIRDFRNTVIGHILDKKTKQPISAAELNAKLVKIFNGSSDEFSLWINNPAGNHFPESVIAIIEQIRNRLMQDYSLKASELFPWKDG